MRGGAIPILVWGTILTVAYALLVIWTGSGVNAAVTGFAVLITFGTGLALVLLRPREALRKGPPPASPEPRAIISSSLGAVLFAIGVGVMVFGFAFGHFIIYFGAGLIVASSGVLTLESASRRRALERWRRANGRPAPSQPAGEDRGGQ